MSRPVGAGAELERRRKQAVQAVSDGEPRKTVAKVLGVHTKTVSRYDSTSSYVPPGVAYDWSSGPRYYGHWRGYHHDWDGGHGHGGHGHHHR
jgi:hypothetical protein